MHQCTVMKPDLMRWLTKHKRALRQGDENLLLQTECNPFIINTQWEGLCNHATNTDKVELIMFGFDT